MTPSRSFEKVSESIGSMSKNQLKKQIRNFRGNFKLDFTDSFLNGCSEDKLRHILLAAVRTKR